MNEGNKYTDQTCTKNVYVMQISWELKNSSAPLMHTQGNKMPTGSKMVC